MAVNEPRASGSATLSAFGLVRGPNAGAVTISNGGPSSRSAMARLVSSSSGSRTNFTSSDEIADHCGLAMERADDGVDGQCPIVDVARALRRLLGEKRAPQP